MDQHHTVSEERITETEWRPDGELTFEQWREDGESLASTYRAIKWKVAAWFTYGEARWGEDVWQIADTIGVLPETLGEWIKVYRLTHAQRHVALSWSHHKLVSRLSPEDQAAWLDHAESEGLNAHELRLALREARVQLEEERPSVAMLTVELDAALIREQKIRHRGREIIHWMAGILLARLGADDALRAEIAARLDEVGKWE